MNIRITQFLPWYLVSRSCAPATLAAICLMLASAAAMQADQRDAGFRFEHLDDQSLGLWEGDRPVLVYNHGEMALAGVPTAGRRASYLHPIYGLDGQVLTDDFPADHYHHRGLFWGWPHVQVGDRQYDLWKVRGIRIEFRRWLAKETGPDGARLGVENAWLVRDRPVMREEAWFDIQSATTDERQIDITLSWTPLDEPVVLGGAEGKSYGGLTLRFAPRQDTIITVPAGRSAEDLLVTRLPWVDFSARFAAADANPPYSGAALFVHPQHPGFPPEWMTREYGLLAIGWPGVNMQELQPGQTVTCRYRLWIHRGLPDVEQIERAYQAYSDQDSATGQVP